MRLFGISVQFTNHDNPLQIDWDAFRDLNGLGVIHSMDAQDYEEEIFEDTWDYDYDYYGMSAAYSIGYDRWTVVTIHLAEHGSMIGLAMTLRAIMRAGGVMGGEVLLRMPIDNPFAFYKLRHVLSARSRHLDASTWSITVDAQLEIGYSSGYEYGGYRYGGGLYPISGVQVLEVIDRLASVTLP